jgi:hypothetical protein
MNGPNFVQTDARTDSSFGRATVWPETVSDAVGRQRLLVVRRLPAAVLLVLAQRYVSLGVAADAAGD